MTANLIKSAVLILVSILSLKYILFWTYIWQLKEYRWDRFKDFLNSPEGRGAFFNKFYLWKIIAAAIITLLSIGFTYYPAIIYFKIYLTFLSLITIFLFFEAVLYLKRTLTKTAKIPVFTKKALLITVIAGLITFSLLAISYSVAAETRQCLPAQADLVSTKWDCLLEQTKIFIPLSLLILICIPLLTAIANLLIYPFS